MKCNMILILTRTGTRTDPTLLWTEPRDGERPDLAVFTRDSLGLVPRESLRFMEASLSQRSSSSRTSFSIWSRFTSSSLRPALSLCQNKLKTIRTMNHKLPYIYLGKGGWCKHCTNTTRRHTSVMLSRSLAIVSRLFSLAFSMASSLTRTASIFDTMLPME